MRKHPRPMRATLLFSSCLLLAQASAQGTSIPCCGITAIDAGKGVVTAKENAATPVCVLDYCSASGMNPTMRS